MQRDAISEGTRSRAVLLLFPALVLLLAAAFVPLDEFIHRGDDAYYYFQVALNHVRYGFWTFDGLHATNGVQPLWAGILTVTAHVLSWLGLSDPEFRAASASSEIPSAPVGALTKLTRPAAAGALAFGCQVSPWPIERVIDGIPSRHGATTPSAR